MIRRILFSVLALALVTSCNNQTKESNAAVTDSIEISSNGEENTSLGVIEFEEETYDFGTVKEGEIVEHVFKFKNTGTAPVILVQVSASCGCTTPEYTKDPVLPGKEGEIKVSFDSNGQVGTQQKIVTVSSNAENRVTSVQLKGIVQ